MNKTKHILFLFHIYKLMTENGCFTLPRLTMKMEAGPTNDGIRPHVYTLSQPEVYSSKSYFIWYSLQWQICSNGILYPRVHCGLPLYI
jgi:hypothetical protein